MQPLDSNSLPEQADNRSTQAEPQPPAVLQGDADLRTWVIATAIAVIHAAALAWGLVVLS